MISNEESGKGRENSGVNPGAYAFLALTGLVSPVITFLIAISGLSRETKIYGLAVTSVIYLSVSIWSYEKLRSGAGRAKIGARDWSDADDNLQDKLLALEDVNEFFGALLKPADIFRLISSRIAEIYPFDASLFFHAGPHGQLKVLHAAGDDAFEPLVGTVVEKGKGLAGLAALSGEIEFSHDTTAEIPNFPPGSLNGVQSSAAIPLRYGDEIFGVVLLLSGQKLPAGGDSRQLLAAVEDRVSPMLRGTLAFEQSLSHALSDPQTNLPNERAFFMILENQLAESIRFRDERPVSIVAADIKGFDEAEAELSPPEIERLLTYVGEVIAGQLRGMDFLARSMSDEFLIILPTAGEAAARDIIARIDSMFAEQKFKNTDGQERRIWLNFGLATFWRDGETADALLRHARLKKQQAKSQAAEKLLWFPKEYVN